MTSVFSGLAVGFLGIKTTLLVGVAALAFTLIHLVFLHILEREVLHTQAQTKWIDIRVGWLAILAVPGLLMLVFFTTFNNLFAGVSMALLDPYGIDMFGVQGWGIWFAVGSTGLFLGGALVAGRGLGTNPIRTMLLVASAPVTALVIAPLAELWIIPHMRTEQGIQQWEWLVGTGDSRGIAVILVFAGLICVILALGALLTPHYRLLSRQFARSATA